MTANRIYIPQVPQNLSPEELPRYLFEELNRIAVALDKMQHGLVLEELNVAPERPVDGLTVRADGTNWNPGSGAGCYQYRGSSWNFLG